MALKAYQINEPKRMGDLIVFEVDPDYTRDVVTLLAGSGAVRNIPMFSVVGKVTASGKWKELATSGSNGDQVAKGIALAEAEAPDGTDDKMLIMARGPTSVRKSQLVWPAGQNDAFKAARIDELLSIGIKVVAD